MNDSNSTVNHVGEIISTITTPHDSDSPQATIIGWSSRAALIPVVHQDQGRAPSPICVAFTETMNQQPVAFARFSENHPNPNHPYPSSNEEAPSASALYQRSITPEAFQQPSPPYMASGSGYGQHRPMPVLQGQEIWSGNSPSGYEVDEYSEGTLRRLRAAPFPAQAQPFSREYELDSCREHEGLDPDCPYHDYSVKSLRARELFIAHVPVDMNEEELKELCLRYGNVISVSIMYHGTGVSPSPRCYAFVKFEQQSAADDALLKLNHHEVSIRS